MARPTQLLFLAFFLTAATSAANGQLLGANITQLQVVGRGLTCSNPSPFPLPFLLRATLSNATVGLSCNGGTTLNTTTTNDAGDFTLVVNNPAITALFPFNCRVSVVIPASCTVTSILFQRITTLKSIALFPIRVQSSEGGGQALVVYSGLLIAN